MSGRWPLGSCAEGGRLRELGFMGVKRESIWAGLASIPTRDDETCHEWEPGDGSNLDLGEYPKPLLFCLSVTPQMFPSIYLLFPCSLL